MTAACLQRYALLLVGYQYDIVYRKTSDHGNANGLSRLPINSPASEADADDDAVDTFHVSQSCDCRASPPRNSPRPDLGCSVPSCPDRRLHITKNAGSPIRLGKFSRMRNYSISKGFKGFKWRLLNKVLPTSDRLSRQGLVDAVRNCPLCGICRETVEHMFFLLSGNKSSVGPTLSGLYWLTSACHQQERCQR